MFKIYWSDAFNQPHSQDETDVTKALAISKEKIDAGYTFVGLVSQNPHQVGKAGVDAVVNGKTPDGHDYDWSKADRAGKPRRNDKIITTKNH
jgi:hypothetical protein